MAENMQVRAAMENSRKRKHSAGSDEDKSTTWKRRCEIFRQNVSPDCTCMSSADFRNISDSSSSSRIYLTVDSKNEDEVRNKNILKTTLQKNYKMLKEKMEPTALAAKLREKNIFSDEVIENISRCLNRQGKNEVLIEELCSIEPNSANSLNYRDIFISLLKETGQEDVVFQLTKPESNVLRQLSPDKQDHDLLTFVQQQKEVLLEEVEPRVFLDDLVASSCISFAEKEEIASLPKRRERVKILLEKIKSSSKSVAVEIAKCITKTNPHLRRQTFSGRSKGQQNLLPEKGSPLNMKISIKNKAVQDMQAHDHPVQTLQEKKNAAEEIERKIVHNLEENKKELEAMFDKCLIGIDKLKFACVKIYLSALSSTSFRKLLAYVKSGAIKAQLRSILDQSERELNSDSQIVLEISEGCQVSEQTETECLCNLDKKAISKNFNFLSKEMECSEVVIRRFIESQLITRKEKENELSMDLVHRNTQLLKFLLHEKVPKTCFCILEAEIIKADGSSIIRSTLKGQLTEHKTDEIDTLTTSDISANKDLLFEELETQWFMSSLEKKKDTSSKSLLANMNKPVPRATKMEKLVDYLLKQSNLTWFAKDLKRYNANLLDALLVRKEASKDKSDFNGLDIKRINTALQFCLDELIEEIDPLLLTKWLGAESQEQLKSNTLRGIAGRSKRAEMFCMSLLRADSGTVQDVLHAMKFCGYEDIVGDIITLAREGPLSNRYRCPNVTNLGKCKENCIYKVTYDLKEIFEEGKALLVPQSHKDNGRDMLVPSSAKSIRKGRVQSLKGGSESGVSSGSGPTSEECNTDDDSDNETKRPDIEQRKQWTKAWIESQGSFGSVVEAPNKIHESKGESNKVPPTVERKFLHPLSPGPNNESCLTSSADEAPNKIQESKGESNKVPTAAKMKFLHP